MVDFNNDSTIGTPAADVEKISILQRRYDLIEAYEKYKKLSLQGANTGISVPRARLISLFLEIQASLERRFDKLKYDKLKELIFAKTMNEEQLLEIIYTINNELDKMKLITIDTQKVYDESSVEDENKEKGY